MEILMAIEFLNPYHFLPLQHEKSLWEDDEKEESYTGMISYEITTRTPLLVPGQVLKMDEKTGHPYKRFFTYDNTGEDLSLKTRYRPAIPGSEIRGVIRSIYETLTNSCLSMIDKETVGIFYESSVAHMTFQAVKLTDLVK